MKERDIEKYLVDRVKEMGGMVRKVRWDGRVGAPDRLVMLPKRPCSEWPFPAMRSAVAVWVELKSPETVDKFPSNAHERTQAREHRRMRDFGQRVEVIGTVEQVDALLS